MFSMLVSLYTVRIVLDTLGLVDYGIYSVVAGVISMFGFLSGSMSMASQRFFSFAIGTGDFYQLKKTFAISWIIYGIMALLALLLFETVGLGFVYHKLVIPTERFEAACQVYQYSVFSFLFSILLIPFTASIIAHEDMSIYAYMSIFDTILKLGIVYLLQYIQLDKLHLYGILMFATSLLVFAVYFCICRIKYKECRFYWYWDKKLFTEIMNFTGWSLFGQLTVVFRNQAVTILLNQLFNPVVVAARTIAQSVANNVNSFSSNFNTGLYPPIIKSYAAGEKKQTLQLMFKGSKLTYFLMFLFTLPLILEMPAILSIWLKNPPEYAVLFTRLALIDALVTSISLPVMTVARATGKVRLYELSLGSMLIASFLISWIVLVMGMPAYSVMIVAIASSCVMFVVRLLIVKQLIAFSLRQFFKEVVFPAFIVSLLSTVISGLVVLILPQGLIQLIIKVSISFVFTSVCIFFIGITRQDRVKLRTIIVNRINNILHK